MALNNRSFSLLFLIISLGVSPAWTWNFDRPRVDGYDLGRGPVVYEAYYPEEDSNERMQNDYQEKRYFDHDAVMEKSYQLPSEVQYSSGSDEFPKVYDTFNLRRTKVEPFESVNSPLSSYIARSRNALEGWASLKDNFNWYPSISNRPRNIDFGEPLRLQRFDERTRTSPEIINRFSSYSSMNDLPENFLERYSYPENRNDLISKKMQNVDRFEPQNSKSYDNIRVSKDLAMDTLPSENIFAPRPQVLNYIFSKSADENKSSNDLVQENRKDDENKENDAKITSIEVSEVPKHKIRHHHGEWLRNFSHFHHT